MIPAALGHREEIRAEIGDEPPRTCHAHLRQIDDAEVRA